jgi:hypothetical protein
MIRAVRTCVCAALLVGVVCATASADVLGPLLPGRVMQAGLSWRKIDRTVGLTPYSGGTLRKTEIDQNDISVFGRYGVTSNATFSFELSVTPDDLAFEDGSGSLYVVGGAVQLGVWTNPYYAVSAGFHYASMYWKNDAAGPDVEEQLLEFTLQLQRSWSFKQADGHLWIAPMISYFSLRGQAPANNLLQEPLDAGGGLIGANAILYHVGVETQYLWVETSELRVAMFYRF